MRDWDEMKDIYETDRDGDIYIQKDEIYFVANMRQFCGRTFTVRKIFYDDNDCFVRIQLNDDDTTSWNFSPSMLENLTRPLKKN